MFPSNFYADRFFGPRFWPPVGGVPGAALVPGFDELIVDSEKQLVFIVPLSAGDALTLTVPKGDTDA